MKVKCRDISDDSGPTIDQRYLQFKAIELDMCQFVFDATPTTVSHWLGQAIKLEALTELESGKCSFKVDKEADSTNTHQKRKRKCH